jgi:protein glucosyltransferase
MLHLLTHYARLLRYRPTVPENATELCLESMACTASGCAREFMMESMEKYVADYEPCALPGPFTADELAELAQRDVEMRSKMKKLEEQEEET